MARTHPPTGPQRPAVDLIVRQGPEAGRRFAITEQEVTVGRHAGCDIQVDDPGVSRQHARITWRETGYAIEDLGSANGTFVNGERLTASRLLKDGDAIGLGQAVLFDFRAAAPVPSSEVPTMADAAAPPAGKPAPPPARGLRRVLIPATALVLCCLLAMVAALGYYFFLWPEEASSPVVLINSPRYGDQVEVGEEVLVRSIARDEGKVARVELWVDGQLQKAQDSTLPGGASPFPLLARWRPSSPGVHTLVVRAFSSRGRRGQASINVGAVELADRDGDRVADDADACPDEPGARAARGCPDRDGDAVADAEDACPDQAGLPEGNGCPAPGAGDRDGDGLLDEADACPDEPGSPLTEGCPNADGDLVRDAEDACPAEPGWSGNNGCPTPGDRDGDGVPDAEDNCPEVPGSAEQAGCSDDDGDGVADVNDACPDEPGLPAQAGCPDRDGDGVPDARDFCPDAPGLPGHGCPDSGAGDKDGDGIPDDVDLAPGEPGLPEHGGAPPPGQGQDADGDGIPDSEEPPESPLDRLLPLISSVGSMRAVPAVMPKSGAMLSIPIGDVSRSPAQLQFEANSLLVDRLYDHVYCYVWLGPEEVPVDRRDLTAIDRLDGNHWDIAAHLSGRASPPFDWPDAAPLRVYIECDGYDPYFADLGIHEELHGPEDWNGAWITRRASGSGGWFEITYRISRLDEVAWPPPVLTMRVLPGRSGHKPIQLVWSWEGDEESINGYRLYRNGSVFRGNLRGQNSTVVTEQPACDETWDFQVAAYAGDYLRPDEESPLSNVVSREGVPCSRVMRVSFDQIQTFDLGEDAEVGRSGVGPFEGEFYANEEEIWYDGCGCHGYLWFGTCDGFRLQNNRTYATRLFLQGITGRECQDAVDRGAWTCCCAYPVGADSIILEMDYDDDLTFGAEIRDCDYGFFIDEDMMFHSELTLPGVRDSLRRVHRLRNRSIEMTVVVDAPEYLQPGWVPSEAQYGGR